MPGLYGKTDRSNGELITDTKYNADHQNHIDNQTPQMTDDYSGSVSQMQTVTDPFPSDAESLATSLAGELERIRFVLKQILGKAQWYNDAPRNLTKHPACEVVRTAALLVANDTDTSVPWTTENLDTDTMHDNVTNNDRITIKTAGVYVIQADGVFATNSAGARIMRLVINNATSATAVVQPFVPGSRPTNLNLSAVRKLAVNDFLHVSVYQASGAALDFGVVDEPQLRFSVAYLGSET